MYSLILIFHIIVSIVLVALVLLQQGKGAEVGAAFGSGASQSVFGSSGSGSFITRLTAIAAACFFAISITLTKLALVDKAAANKFNPVVVQPIKSTKQPATNKVSPEKNNTKESKK